MKNSNTTQTQSTINMQKIFQYFTESQDIAIENYIFKRLAVVFTLFLLAMLFLFITIEQEKPASQKFSFTALFHKKAQEQVAPLHASVDIPPLEIAPAPIEEPKPTLLPKGDTLGSGKILQPSISYTETSSTITVPYQGTITDYQVTNFDKNSVHSRIISLPGTWEKNAYTLRDADNPLVRLVQTANHKNEYRISISAANGIRRLKEEIYYTDTELKIVITADDS